MAPKAAKKAIDKPKTKRAPSSYMIFANENRARVIQEYGFQKGDIGPIGKKLGELWNALPQKEKDAYKSKSVSHKQ